ATALLERLLAARGRPVAKDELMASAWPGIVVEDGNLTVQIANLRKALGTTPDGQDWIATVPRLGYRLAAADEAATRVGPPRIAVLPFLNLTGDPSQQYLADGLVEELASAFSRFRSFSVMARSAIHAHRSRVAGNVDSARLLGVDYAVEGSLQTHGSELRVTIGLADHEDSILWSRSYRGSIDTLFDFQDAAVSDVAAIIEPRIRRAELQRARATRPANAAAYDLYLQAVAGIHAHDADDNAQAIELLDQAMALEPGNGTYAGFACWAREMRITMGWPRLPADDAERCVELANRAIADAADDAQILAHCGLAVQLVAREYERGLLVVERAAQLNPHDPVVLLNCGIAHYLGGSLETALALLHRTIALQPNHAFEAMGVIGNVCSALGDHESALAWARRGLAINDSYQPNHWVAVSAAAHLGRLDEAAAALRLLREKVPGLTVASLLVVRPSDTRRDQVIAEGLRLAGLPEGPSPGN
ncbi:winged helix-turn-helix domain-containing protein, partial [Devosia sp.]|uniref:winged helix-turn-helix domain-containing protein n=1 Tax=Devosia sp. TaxID=1871048 RepID=UPI001AC5A2DE